MSSMKIVILGTRAVHDGLGNKLEGTTTDPRTGQIISRPVHTVPAKVGHIICGSGMGEMVDEPVPMPEQEPTPAPSQDPVEAGIAAAEAEAAPEPTPEPAPAADSVEDGIKQAEAEAAPATEAEKAGAESEAGEDVAAELAAAAEANTTEG